MEKIPFTKITLGEEEIQAVADIIRSGWVVMGAKTKEFEERFAEYIGAKYAIFVDSCTSALDLSVKYKIQSGEWKIGDVVSVPSLTFASSAEVLVNNGLIPGFVDVSREDFCALPLPAPAIAVHLTGNKVKGTNFSDFGFSIIEDSAHLIEKDQCKGSSNLVCFSFYATKNLNTVQGGMIATNSGEIASWLRKARDHGISQGTTERYKEGKWAYQIEFVGWREKSDDLHAAIGLEQLKKLPAMTEERNRVVKTYNKLLGLDRNGNHLYPILVEKRPEFMDFMAQKQIQCSVHFLPLHRMPAYRKYAEGIELPNTEYLGERLVSLPLYSTMTKEEIEYVVSCVKESGLFIRE